jgi:hypothetical protein
MQITLHPAQWVDIKIDTPRIFEYRKRVLGQQCFLLPQDIEIHGSVSCTHDSVIRAFNASYEIMIIEI